MSNLKVYTFLNYLYRNNNKLLPRAFGFKKTTLQGYVSSSINFAKAILPASEPDKIHAAVLKKFSDTLSIENLDKPAILKDNEVIIDIHYCAINISDILLSKNLYSFEPSLPLILGYEVVGKLIDVGEIAQKSGYKVGDKVIAINKECYGGFAEQCVAEIENIWKIPSSTKSLDAVCLLDNYMTALIGLERQVTMSDNDTILINVGVSGVGLAAVDLAANVYRAKVIGICANEDGTALVREKGAYASLTFKDSRLLKQIEALAAEKNIKAVFDGTTGEYFKKVLHCFTDIYKDNTSLKDSLRDDNFAVAVHHLSREERIIVAGVATTSLQDQTEVEPGSFNVTGFNLQEYKKTKPEEYRQAGDDVLEFFEEGLIKPTCSLVSGLYKVNDALQFAAEMKSTGKVIIDIRNKDGDPEQVTK